MDSYMEGGRSGDPQMEGDLSSKNGSFQLPVKVGEGDERVISVRPGDSLIEITRIFATERGCAVEELTIFREGEREVISSLVIVDAEYPCRRRHHVHHASGIGVTVHYQAASHHHAFKRYESVEDVLLWAVGVFGIDPGMAAEFELARHGQQVELPGSEHIGHVAGHGHHTVELDLIRGAIANG